MKKNYKEKTFNNRDDTHEKKVDSNSDDDFRPPLLFIKRSRNNTQNNCPQPKRLKDKDGSTPSDTQDKINSTNNTGFYVASEPSLVNTANMNDCYDFDSNGDSHESTAQRPVQDESSKPTHLPEISFISTACGDKLTTNSDFILKEFVRKGFFVEVFLSLISRTGRRSSGKVKNTTAKYRRLISQYQSSYFKDAAYTPLKLTNAQQKAFMNVPKFKRCIITISRPILVTGCVL
ncbi:hypothetical protein G6F56_002722 [Rhizopus delemar]|nr:hypothetical protein G6F56_002722 [Rhizopus delemar]